jgi:hypothetical protein
LHWKSLVLKFQKGKDCAIKLEKWMDEEVEFTGAAQAQVPLMVDHNGNVLSRAGHSPQCAACFEDARRVPHAPTKSKRTSKTQAPPQVLKSKDVIIASDPKSDTTDTSADGMPEYEGPHDPDLPLPPKRKYTMSGQSTDYDVAPKLAKKRHPIMHEGKPGATFPSRLLDASLQ